MWETLAQPLRAAILTAFVAGLLLFLLEPPSLGGLDRPADHHRRRHPDRHSHRLGDRAPDRRGDARARVPAARGPQRGPRRGCRSSTPPPSEFDELVIQALDDLPAEFQEVLETTPVVVSNLGHEFGAYGHYIGGTVARDIYPDRIVVYEDTLDPRLRPRPGPAASPGRAHRAPRGRPPPRLGRARRARPRPLGRRWKRCSAGSPRDAGSRASLRLWVCVRCARPHRTR